LTKDIIGGIMKTLKTYVYIAVTVGILIMAGWIIKLEYQRVIAIELIIEQLENISRGG